MFNFGITVMVSYFLISFSGMAQTAGYFSQSGKLKTEKKVQSYSLYDYKRSSVTNEGASNKSEQSDIISAADPEYISTSSLTERGSIFENVFENRMKNNSCTDIMQIKNLGDSVHALQFKLLVNESPDDSTFLIFRDIQKGTDVSDTSWVLDYFVIRDTKEPNRASKDQVYVLLYNLTQYGNLPPGDLNELLKVNYCVADIPDLQNNIKSSFKITNTAASTSLGNPVDITPSRDELKIFAVNENYGSGINNQKVVQNQVEIIYGAPPDLPLNYMLYQNFPNPFNPSTTIKYSVPVTSNVIIKVFDIIGNEVTSLVNEVEDQGNYSVNLSAKGLASGIYFYRMQAIPTDGQPGDYIQTKKMVILK